jgi:prevent-host-death family protein
MTRVAVSRLKAQLSQYLARVKAGEQVIITERNRPIAKLIPVPARDGLDERMLDLERRGLVKINGDGRIPDDFFERPKPLDPDGLVLKARLEEREQSL